MQRVASNDALQVRGRDEGQQYSRRVCRSCVASKDFMGRAIYSRGVNNVEEGKNIKKGHEEGADSSEDDDAKN